MALGILAIAAVVAGVGLLVYAHFAGVDSMAGGPVVGDDGGLPKAEDIEKMRVESTGIRLSIPSVGLDVPIDAISPVDGIVNPPGYTSAYWIRTLGVSPDEPDAGTVFIAAHSVRGGAVAPGNYMIDIDAQASSLQPGDVVFVGDTTYEVTSWEAILKSEIASASRVWENTPGRLQLITCLQQSTDPSVPSVSNIIVTAERVDGGESLGAGSVDEPQGSSRHRSGQ